MSEYFVRLIDMPCTVGGFVKPNDDGTFSVYLNSRLSVEQNRKSLQHELNHITHDDFCRNVSVAQKEKEAV